MDDTLPEDPSAAVAFPDFPVALRGYERAAVDAYVKRVVKLVDQLDAIRSPQGAVRVALERVGEETSAILAQAHATAEEVTGKARREAEERESSSRREAEERVARAHEEAAEIVRTAEARVAELDRDADVIWQDRLRLLADARRIAADLERVAGAAHERFPAEAEEDAEATQEIASAPDGDGPAPA